MKTNSTRLLEILNSEKLGFFSLVEFKWNSNHYYTDLGYDVTWGGSSYLSNNPIVGFDTPRYSNVVDRELFQMQVSGLDSRMIDEVNAGISGLPVTIRIVYTIDGVPQLGVNDTLLLYDGLVSKTSTSIDDEGKVIVVECTAPLSSLDERGTLYTTKDGMKSYDPSDTCFDTVSDNSEPVNVRWGKV